MTLDYLPDFIKAYYLNCAKCKTKEQAYDATELQYSLQYKQEIGKGLMKESRFSSYESFRAALTQFLRNPKNRQRIDI